MLIEGEEAILLGYCPLQTLRVWFSSCGNVGFVA